LLVPEYTGAFEAQVDDAADGALHWTAADGEATTASDIVFEAEAMADEIAFLLVDLLSVSASCGCLIGGYDLIGVSLFEKAAMSANPLLSVSR